MTATLTLFASVLLGAAIAVSAEQCRRHPGEIKFDFEETSDQDQWYGKYGGKVYGKYGFGQYKKSNNVFIIPQQQQFFQQNQVQQNVFAEPEPEPETTTAEGLAEDEEEDTVPDTLPIWRVQLPRNVIWASIRKLEAGQLDEGFEIDSSHFANASLTKVDGSSYTKSVDITEQGVSVYGWYLVCMNLSVSDGGALNACSHCTLVRACNVSYGCYQKALTARLIREGNTKTEAEVVLETRDLPVRKAAVNAKLRFTPRDARCAAHTNIELGKSVFVYPETTTELKFERLRPDMTYRLRVDLELTVGGKGVMLSDYLSDESAVVGKCGNEREFYPEFPPDIPEPPEPHKR